MRQLLVVLACPAMMAVMMLMMRRGHQAPDAETIRLREEAAGLRKALQDQSASSDERP